MVSDTIELGNVPPLFRATLFAGLWAVFALATASLCGCTDPKPTDPALNNALAQARWVEPRLSWDDWSASCLRPTLPDVACRSTLDAAQRRRLEQTLDALRGQFSPHQRALWSLVRGSAPLQAASRLEALARGSPRSAALWNDFAAAAFLSREGSADWRALNSALQAADRAIAIDPRAARPRFNRALILTELALPQAAVAALEAARARASHRGWRREASARIAALHASPGRRNRGGPPAAGQDGDGQDASQGRARVPDGSGAAVLRSPASRRSAAMTALLDNGRALTRAVDGPDACDTFRDRWVRPGAFTTDAVVPAFADWLCAAPPSPAAASRATQARLLADALAGYHLSRTRDALAAVDRLRPALDDAPQAVRDVVDLVEGSSHFSLEDYAAATPILQRAASSASHAVASRALERLGTGFGRQGDVAGAFLAYERALARLAGGADPSRRVRIQALRAEALSHFGRYDEAWQEALAALRQTHALALPARLTATVCEMLALIAAQSGAHALQLQYAHCAIDYLPAGEDPSYVLASYLARARAWTAWGRLDAAEDDLAAARRVALQMTDVEERDNSLRYVDLEAGHLLVRRAPARAVARLQRARRYFDDSGHLENAILARRGLVDAHLAAGDTAASDRALQDLATLVAQAQANAAGADFALPVHEHYRQVFQRQIRAALRTGGPEAAYAALLRSRTGVARGQAASPTDARTLTYAWLGDEVAGWVTEGDHLVTSFRSRAPDGTDWSTLVGLAAGTAPAPAGSGRLHALATLYDTLVRPAALDADDDRPLILVPDGPLFGVPFAALWNAAEQRYLVEEMQLVVSPEPPAAASAPVAPLAPGHTAALFADPHADPRRPLLSVSEEISRVLGTLEGANLEVTHFQGEGLTAANFLAALRRFDVLHFGGHGDVDLRDPGRSRLVLRRHHDGVEVVTAAELRALAADGAMAPGEAPALVVLAACDTAAYTDHLPHALALVRPLLELGAQRVIASLRPVEDHDYVALMGDFYRYLVQLQDPGRALRAAQLQAARASASPGVPRAWEFLQVFQAW